MKNFKKSLSQILKATSFASLVMIAVVQKSNAQNVGIGATSFIPDPQSMLDVQSTSKGILIPRMTDLQRIAIVPTPGSDYGLLVYQTNTVSTTNVAGYWYWDGSFWVKLTSGIDWNTLGNSGTNPVTNFIGTIDANDFVMRTANSERVRIKSTGSVGIGTSIPSQMLSVAAGMNVDNNNTNSGSLTNALLFGGSGTLEGIASKRTTGGNQFGLDFYTGNLNRLAITNGGNVGIGTTSPASQLQVNASWDGIIVNSSGTGIVVNNAGINSFGWNMVGYGYGPWTNFAGNYGIACGGIGHGIEASAWDDNSAATDHSGGTFLIQNNAKNNLVAGASVAAKLGGTIYKVVGSGTVSTIVADLQNNPRTMSCPETPEVLLQDFGTSELKNGKVHINLDPILSKNIKVDATHAIKIFVQLEDNCNGVFVTNKSATGFDVNELNNGSSNAKFSWFVSANRANEVIGGSPSDYESFRFKPMMNAMYQHAFDGKNFHQ